MADRKLIVTILGDDTSFQRALTRSSAAASRFSRDVNRKLGSGVSVGRNFDPLLRSTRELRGEADQLGRKLSTMEGGFAGAGTAADGAAGSLTKFVARAGLLGVAVTTAYHASRSLSDALETTGEEAFTATGRLKNFGSALLSGDIVSGIQALTKMPKTLDEAGISATEATARYNDFKRIVQSDVGGSLRRVAEQAVTLVDNIRSAQAASDALADAVGRVGTAFRDINGQAVIFKGHVDDLGGLRGPGLVEQINTNLEANRFPRFPTPLKPIGPTAKNAAAQILAQARGDLPELLRLQIVERDRLAKALAISHGNVEQRTKLNAELTQARAAVIGTQKAIEQNAAAEKASAEAAAKAAAAAAKARADEARRAREAAEALRRRIADERRAREQIRQFRALGLGPTGEAMVPGVENLLKRIKGVFARVDAGDLNIGSKLATSLRLAQRLIKTQGDKLTEETRRVINDFIRAANGRDATEKLNGPLTTTEALRPNKILEGLGLSRDAEKELRARLSQFNSAGLARGGNIATGVTTAKQPISVTVVSTLDGKVVGQNTKKFLLNDRRFNPPQKRGPNAG